MPAGSSGGGSGTPGHRRVWISVDVDVFYRSDTTLYYAVDWGRGIQVSSNADPSTVINAAITYVNGTLGGGQVRLLGGAYALTSSIIMLTNVILSGEGYYTYLDGTGLATTEHAIICSGIDDWTLRDFAVSTEAEGGKNCNCIFIEDDIDRFTIENIYFIDSDTDAIHIEGTGISNGIITNNFIVDADETGINIAMDAANYMDYLQIKNNIIASAGQEGISFTDGRYSEISGNIIYGNGQDGIELNLTIDTLIEGNIIYSNTQHGISLINADRNTITENICHTNDAGDTALYDGINIDGNSTENNIEENYCYLNHRYGIATSGLRTNIQGNQVFGNDRHGIYEDITDCVINDNFCYDNSQDQAGTYHNIYVGGARTDVIGNYCVDPGDSTEDGIFLALGADQCNITGNFCYNLMGDGIELNNNNNCLICGNHLYSNDDCGIVVTGTTGNNNSIQSNYCVKNGLDGIQVNSPENAINDNYIYDNSRLQGGNSHGINIANALADRCLIEGNYIVGDGTNQENGINLVNGASDCNIIGNYIYNNAGDGIYLAQNNVDCSVNNNYITTNDDDGVFIGADSLRTAVNSNHIILNGLHGVRCEAGHCQINANYIYMNSQTAAATYHGIILNASDVDDCQICDNYISDDGSNVEDGIHLVDGVINCLIDGNYIRNHMGDGIDLVANNDDCQIKNNYLTLNDDYGVRIRAATCNNNVVQNNKYVGNVTGAISDGGTDTILEQYFGPITDPDHLLANTHPVIRLQDGLNQMLNIQWLAPREFQELVRSQGIFVADSAGNMDFWSIAQFGKICLEPWNMHYGSVTEAAHTFDYAGSFECIDISTALTGITAGDLAGIALGRGGANAADTINDDVWCFGINMEYV